MKDDVDRTEKNTIGRFDHIEKILFIQISITFVDGNVERVDLNVRISNVFEKNLFKSTKNKTDHDEMKP